VEERARVLHDDELTDLYLSLLTKSYLGSPIRAVELGKACGKHEEKRNEYIFVRKT
jgi:hypothetical protein